MPNQQGGQSTATTKANVNDKKERKKKDGLKKRGMESPFKKDAHVCVSYR
jgi:hypothetical protein